MEPLTALGLAGNIITFIEFTTKLYKKTMEVYKVSEDSWFDRRNPTAPSHGVPEFAEENQLSDRELLEARLSGFILTTNKISETASKKYNPIAFEVNGEVLDTNLQRFIGYSETLSISDGPHKAPGFSPTSVEGVAEASNLVARRMIDHLERVKKSTKGKIWPSLKLALREVLKESEIKEMHATLNMYQERLILLVVVSLRY